MTVDEIEMRLANNTGAFQFSDPFPAGFFEQRPVAASVLVPLYRHEDAWYLLFIRRTQHVHDQHSGQVAFPGGKAEPGDVDAVATALRECQEEIGIQRENIRVLGCLGEYRTISNFMVTPVIALIDWPLTLDIDTTEVDHVFSIPLEWLSGPDNLQVQDRPLPGFDSTVPVYQFEHYDGELLWGITAKIAVGLMHILGMLSMPHFARQD